VSADRRRRRCRPHEATGARASRKVSRSARERFEHSGGIIWCVHTPRLPSCTAYARHHRGTGHRRVARPEDGPKRACGRRELKRAPHNRGIASPAAGAAPSDGGVAITGRGLPRQVVAACWEGRCHGPAWGVTRHDLLRPHGAVYAHERLVTRGPGTSRDVDPSDVNQILSAAVPVTRARAPLEISGASPLPCHREAGALGRVRHDGVRGRAFRAFHTWASPGAMRARGRRRVPGGITRKLADQRERELGVGTSVVHKLVIPRDCM
jgi:hypothetical protein